MLDQLRARRTPATVTSDGPVGRGPWRARIAKLRFVLVALAATFGGLTLLMETAELLTQVETWVGYVGFMLSGLSAVVTQVIDKAGATLRDHPRFVFWVLVSVNAVYLVVATIAIITHGQLRAGDPADLVLPAGAQQELRFTVDPGDHVIIRLRADTPGIAIAARARNGARDEVIEQVDPRRWEHRGVLEGGEWRLVIANDDDAEVGLRASFDIVAGGLSLATGEARRGQIASSSTTNGYVIRVDEPVEAQLLVEPLSNGELPLAVSAFAATQRIGIPVQRADGISELVLPLDPGRDHVVAVRALDGAVGSYRIRLLEAATVGEVPLEPAPPPTGSVALPELYDVGEGEAFERLTAAGFEDVDAIRVCSSSVDEGRVRQAFVLNDAGREVIVADRPDLAPSGTRVEVNETIQLKVSTGRACE